MEMNGVTTINRPVQNVYDYVIDLSNDPKWRTGPEESGWCEGQTPGLGAIGYTRAGDREMEWRVVTYEPGKQVEWEFLSGPLLGRGGYLLEAVEGGTRFTLLADVRPAGVYKLLGPIFGWVGRRQNQADVERLKGILELMPAQ